MNFKARITNYPSMALSEGFQLRTSADTKHRIDYEEGSTYGSDKFTLYKDGAKTAEYCTDKPISEGCKGLNTLMSIFNILKAKEAEHFIKERRKKTAS